MNSLCWIVVSLELVPDEEKILHEGVAKMHYASSFSFWLVGVPWVMHPSYCPHIYPIQYIIDLFDLRQIVHILIVFIHVSFLY